MRPYPKKQTIVGLLLIEYDYTDTCKEELECLCQEIPPPKPHSHYVQNLTPCRYLGGLCIGVCAYACDEGYQWNPVTKTCDLIPVTATLGTVKGWNPLMVISIHYYEKTYKSRRRKKLSVI